jgi:hypothetical protein
VRVNVGFIPTNEAWTSDTAELGLFLFQSGDNDTNRYKAAFLNGCRAYNDNFVDEFIQKDKTWKVSRIMAYVAAGGGILSTIIAWFFVLTPLPAFFIWPAIMLPALMAAFLAEGSKFLFFDTSICRNSIWFPQGADSLPRIAEDCSLGDTAKYSIAAASIYFLSLVAVCLKGPEMRDLDPNYGLDFENGDQVETSEDFNDTGSEHERHSSMRHRGSYVDESDYSITTKGYDSDLAALESGASRLSYDEDDLVVQRIHSLDKDNYQTPKKILKQDFREITKEEEDDYRHNPKKPPQTIFSVPVTAIDPPLVSESRLSTVQKLASTISPSDSKQDLIDKFVSDFNASFEKDL